MGGWLAGWPGIARDASMKHHPAKQLQLQYE
jgi:hypothetical protein